MIYWLKGFIPRFLRLPMNCQWRDADDVMFEACFKVLADFVTKELGAYNPMQMTDDCRHRGYRLHSEGGTDEKAIDLYLWYKMELPELQERHGENKYRPHHMVEDLKQEKLKELIEIRQTLWT